MLFDELSSSLDEKTEEILIRNLVNNLPGHTMLFITHDFSVLARATTRCVVLDEGSVVETGETAALLAGPQDERTERRVRAARALTLHTAWPDATRDASAAASAQVSARECDEAEVRA